MTARALQRLLCRLGRRIATADMREWVAAMTREIDEIDDTRTALEWGAACFVSCAMQRLRASLRIAAAAARYVLGGYCLIAAGQTAIQIAALIAQGKTAPWKIGSWLLIALLVGATGPLVALRRPASAWTLFIATMIMTAALFVGVGGAPADTASRERLAVTVMIGAMLLMTGSVFGLTRRPDAGRTI